MKLAVSWVAQQRTSPLGMQVSPQARVSEAAGAAAVEMVVETGSARNLCVLMMVVTLNVNDVSVDVVVWIVMARWLRNDARTTGPWPSASEEAMLGSGASMSTILALSL